MGPRQLFIKWNTRQGPNKTKRIEDTVKQLTQKLKDGNLKIVEVNWPLLGAGQILVQNHFSVISAGTESSTVNTARKSLVGKAKERPQQVQQVVQTLQAQGPVQTYRAVMKKLNSHSPMGYSSAGIVIGVGANVKGFVKGDKVACAGVGYANHAEVVAIPRNLCVKLPPDANLEHAAYNTVGAIALQGIRQAKPQIGETCLVIGLGLIGQLTCLLLRASGVKVIGVDIQDAAVERATEHSADLALSSIQDNVPARVGEFTNGTGVDHAIITAATSSNDPINLAGECLRQKGTAVVVGAVSTDFDRNHFYLKELDLRMSCSYGPGRYDLDYEDLGRDYPIGYVRWTENRNMEAFQSLIYSGKLDPSFITSHRFKLEAAPEAYDLILNGAEPYCGLVIEYDATPCTPSNQAISFARASSQPDAVNVGFIGAGSYAMNNLLPNVKQCNANMVGVMTSRGTSSRSVAERFGFDFSTSNQVDMLDSSKINTIFIATRHDSHAQYVLDALQTGQNVFVEKPLCLTLEQLTTIDTFINQEGHTVQPRLMVGFNRRFASLTQELKSRFREGPMSMLYRVNAGSIPAQSWIQHPELGGGRIIGEACHFIDFMTFLNGSAPTSVSATSLTTPEDSEDIAHINLKFENGSVGTLIYHSNGSKQLPKEYFEVHQDGQSATLDDFKKLTVHSSGKPFQKKLLIQDKGQADMVRAFINAIHTGAASPIAYSDLYAVTLASLKAVDSLRDDTTYQLSKHPL